MDSVILGLLTVMYTMMLGCIKYQLQRSKIVDDGSVYP